MRTGTPTDILPDYPEVQGAFKDLMTHCSCDSHYLSHFAAFFIVVGAKTSVAESVGYFGICVPGQVSMKPSPIRTVQTGTRGSSSRQRANCRVENVWLRAGALASSESHNQVAISHGFTGRTSSRRDWRRPPGQSKLPQADESAPSAKPRDRLLFFWRVGPPP